MGDDTWAGLADRFADEASATVKGYVRTSVMHCASQAVLQQWGSIAQRTPMQPLQAGSKTPPSTQWLRVQTVAQVTPAASTSSSREPACFALVVL